MKNRLLPNRYERGYPQIMAISKGAKVSGRPPEIGVVSAYDHQSMIWLALSHSLACKLCIVL